MTNLCQTVRQDSTQTVYTVAEVKGQLSSVGLADQIRAACAAKGTTPEIVTRTMDKLPALGSGGKEEVIDRRIALADRGKLHSPTKRHTTGRT
jgi:hypothetical protein